MGAYADSLVPIFLWLVPMFLLGTVIAFFLPEVPLSSTAPAGEVQGEDEEGTDGPAEVPAQTVRDGATDTDRPVTPGVS